LARLLQMPRNMRNRIHTSTLLASLLVSSAAGASPDGGFWPVRDGGFSEAATGGGPCTTTDECAQPTPYCSQPLLKCVQCLGDHNCAYGQSCDTDRGLCVSCKSDLDCGSWAPYCDSAQGACVECRTNGNCGSSGLACVSGTCGSCGDGICRDGYEWAWNCPEDCTVCGDWYCSGNETIESCPQDCSYTYYYGTDGGSYGADASFGADASYGGYWGAVDSGAWQSDAAPSTWGEASSPETVEGGGAPVVDPGRLDSDARPTIPALATDGGHVLEGDAAAPLAVVAAEDAGASAPDGTPEPGAGCSCSVPARTGGGDSGIFAALALAMALVRRRRA
jgi:MYXO-CTERM domain-containing protein